MSRNRNYNKNNNYNNNFNRAPPRKPEFVEDLEAAFFLGKLNKHHDREQVYNQLKRLTKELDFYIKRFDMPNGPNGRGNKGFAFVHCKTRQQARQIISMKFLRLGNQDCEVKPYGGRTAAAGSESICSEGRGTPDSGCQVPVSAKFENPLKQQEMIIPENMEVEVRSRMNSGIQVSESGRFSDKISTRNVSESEETQKITSELSQKQQTEEYNNEATTEINYEQASPVISLDNADTDLRDYWLEEQTNFLFALLGESERNWGEFKFHCDGFMELLIKSDSQTIQNMQRILSNQQTTIGCI